jgi:hypothetical protein
MDYSSTAGLNFNRIQHLSPYKLFRYQRLNRPVYLITATMFKLQISDLTNFSAIQYIGFDGISNSCLNAVRDLIQCGRRIESARILTFENGHALLLSGEQLGPIAIKSGFSSGYAGAGPSAFSEVLQLLDIVDVEVEEHLVSEDIFKRLGASALLNEDLERIKESRPVRPQRWFDYINESKMPTENAAKLLHMFDPVMPWSIVDSDLIDIALKFFDDPDKAILDAFRRLEDRVRRRTDLTEHGGKLFSQAFSVEDSVLHWEGIDRGEQVGRAQLFTGAFQAFRNPRAHREIRDGGGIPLSEFLMVNQLFILERQAKKRPNTPPAEKTHSEARMAKGSNLEPAKTRLKN